MTKRLRQIPLLFIILVSAAALPGQLSEIKTNWPIIRLWPDPTTQMTLMLDDVPYQTLKSAAEQLAPDVTVLLVTSGQDVRRVEYTTYHRALYLLTPRPVWWLSPAPADGTWESRWWISSPLTAENITNVAAQKSADCLLLIDIPAQPNLGPSVSHLPNAEIIQVGSKNCLANTPTPIINYPSPFWPLRLLPALFIILIYGFGFLSLAKRLNGRINQLETLALSWLIGAGLLSTFMFWLNGLGFSLNNQLVILTTGAVLIVIWQKRLIVQSLTYIRFNLPAIHPENWQLAKITSPFNNVERFGKSLSFENPKTQQYRAKDSQWQQTAVLLLAAFLLFQLLFVALMAIGRPLTIWDSWVNWGSKGRTIFLENGITPALYAEPSRQVMLLGYPLSIPLLEAWLYRWLGAADDRLVGILFVFTYLALGIFLYSFGRRRSLKKFTALLTLGAALSLGHIVGLTTAAFTDLWLAALLLVAAAFLIEWLETKQTGRLLIAAVAAGQLPWIKQEGLILIIVLLQSLTLHLLMQRNLRQVVPTLLRISLPVGFAAFIFGLPWRFFAAREATLVSVFLPLTLETIQANLSRLPVILALVGRELLNVRTGFLWPLAAAVLLSRPKQLTQLIKRPTILLLIIPTIYLPLMSIPYLFSDFIPYQQHILSSFFRINAHVLPILLLWLSLNLTADEQ